MDLEELSSINISWVCSRAKVERICECGAYICLLCALRSKMDFVLEQGLQCLGPISSDRSHAQSGSASRLECVHLIESMLRLTALEAVFRALARLGYLFAKIDTLA
jgi:hypothetical protein